MVNLGVTTAALLRLSGSFCGSFTVAPSYSTGSFEASEPGAIFNPHSAARQERETLVRICAVIGSWIPSPGKL
jgi:hypothetical protein